MFGSTCFVVFAAIGLSSLLWIFLSTGEINFSAAARGLVIQPNTLRKRTTVVEPSAVDGRHGHHNLTLTHVVVPFYEKQIDKLEATLEIWKLYKPCSIGGRLATGGVARPSLVFQASFSAGGNVDERIESVRERSMNAFGALPSTIQMCFDSVTFEPLQLGPYSNQNKEYIDSARLMFEEFLDGKVATIGAAVSYCLYMEPDLRPVQSDWLEHVIAQVAWPIPEFWVKGSIFRGESTIMGDGGGTLHGNPLFSLTSAEFLAFLPFTLMSRLAVHLGYIPNLWHINGNAIYNVGSEAFRNFYHNEIRRYVVRLHGDSVNAYDTDFFEYMMDLNNYDKTRTMIHLYQYTDLILNMWHTKYSRREIIEKFPNTVLVHGGVPEE